MSKYTDNEKWYEERIASLSDERKEKLQEAFRPTFIDKVNYGLDSTRWLPTQAFSYIEHGGNQKLLEQDKLKREEALNRKYSHLTEEDRNSGAALTGSLSKILLDPTYWAAGYLTAPTQLARMAGVSGRLARGGFEASKWGAVSGGASALHQATEEEEINPTEIALHTLMGAGIAGPLGMLRKAVPSKLPAATSQASKKRPLPSSDKPRQTRAASAVDDKTPKVIKESNPIINKFLPEVGTSEYNVLKDFPINSIAIHEATKAQAAFKAASSLVKKKSTTAPTAQELKVLKKANAAATKFLKPENLLKMWERGTDVVTDVSLKSIAEAGRQGITDPSVISYLITRPLVGAAAGYGIGQTTRLISGEKEDGLSPWFWIGLGLSGGVLSNKLRTASLSPTQKATAADSLDTLLRGSLRAQAALLSAGTMSAANNVLGGFPAKLNRAFSFQFGPGLKKAATPGLETKSELALSEINSGIFKTAERNLMHEASQEVTALSDVVWHHAERMANTKSGRHTVASLTQEVKKNPLLKNILTSDKFPSITTERELLIAVRNASDDFILTQNQLSNETYRVVPWAKRIEDRVFTQKWDIAKIQENPEQAKEALIKAYKQQALEKFREQGSKGNLKLRLKNAEARAVAQVDNVLAHGRPSAPSFGKGSKPSEEEPLWMKKKSYLELNSGRPLIGTLERDRQLTSRKGRKLFKDFLIRDPKQLIMMEAESSVPTIEFVREFGSHGQVINAIKAQTHKDFEALRKAAKAKDPLGKDIPKLNKLEQQHHKAIETMVDLYFKRHHSQSPLASSNIAHTIAGFLTTAANTAYLPKVTITSLGDLSLPFQNSGIMNTIKGTLSTVQKGKDFASRLDFSARDPAMAELSALVARTNNPGSLTQTALHKLNQRFFALIGLPTLTRFSRRQAFNTGVINSFDTAKKMVNSPSRSLRFRANQLGLKPDYINTLNKFDNVESALKDEKARRILTIGGRLDADFNSLIPSIFNRRAFTQSNDPIIRSLGQFLSWAQAKTSQTNALVKRIEDGDMALAVRMVGSLIVYDGILTFRDLLNDPTGERLKEEGYSSRLDKATSLRQLGRTLNFSANFGPWYGDKVSSLMSSSTSRDSLGNISPGLSWLTEATRVLSPVPYRGMTGSAWRNIGQGDWEGTVKQISNIVPFGREAVAGASALGYKIEDKPPSQLNGESSQREFYGLAKGGKVENVPQVPEEPDERIDKMTGLPYNVQAGKAFIDEEDPEKRTGLNAGGIAYDDSLERLGFITGGIAKAASFVAGSLGKRKTSKVSPTKFQTGRGYEDDVVRKAEQEINIMAEAGDTGEDLVRASLPDSKDIQQWRVETKAKLDSRGWQTGGVPMPYRVRESLIDLEEKAVSFTNKEISVEKYKIALEGHDDLIMKEFPPTVFYSSPEPANARDIFRATATLKEGQIIKSVEPKKVIGFNYKLKEEELVALRLDIPAYNNYDTWVVTIHTAKDAKDTGGKVIGYAATGHIKNVTFGSSSVAALKIAKGEKNKSTIARMIGKWQDHSSDDLHRKAVDLLDATNPEAKEWIQVGMNPFRHSYFYDKVSLEPLKSADEVIQIGGLVLAKNPSYTTKFNKDFLVRSKTQAKKGEAPETLMHFEKGGIVGEELDRLGYVEGGAVDQLEMIDLESLPKKRPMPILTLRQSLVSSLTPASPDQNREMFGTRRKAIRDKRWGEVSNNIAYINHDKFKKARAVNYEPDMLFGESMHNLKTVAPTVHSKIYQSALNDPATKDWLQQSYEWSRKNTGEQREFIPFVRDSRLDQVIGAYFLASPDSPLPTMQKWDANMEGYGTEFRQALEDFKGILDQPFDSEEDRQTFARMTGPEYTGAKTFPLPERGQVEVEQLPSIDLNASVDLNEVYTIPSDVRVKGIPMLLGATQLTDTDSLKYRPFKLGAYDADITREELREVPDPVQTVIMSLNLDERGLGQVRTEEDLNEGVHQAFKDAAAVALADGRREVSFHDYGDTDILLPKERWFDENTPRYLSVAASVGDNVDEYQNPMPPEIREQYSADRASVWAINDFRKIRSLQQAVKNDPKIKAAWSVGRFAIHGEEGNFYMNDYFNFNTINRMGKDFYSFIRSGLSELEEMPLKDEDFGVQTRVRLN